MSRLPGGGAQRAFGGGAYLADAGVFPGGVGLAGHVLGKAGAVFGLQQAVDGFGAGVDGKFVAAPDALFDGLQAVAGGGLDGVGCGLPGGVVKALFFSCAAIPSGLAGDVDAVCGVDVEPGHEVGQVGFAELVAVVLQLFEPGEAGVVGRHVVGAAHPGAGAGFQGGAEELFGVGADGEGAYLRPRLVEDGGFLVVELPVLHQRRVLAFQLAVVLAQGVLVGGVPLRHVAAGAAPVEQAVVVAPLIAGFAFGEAGGGFVAAAEVVEFVADEGDGVAAVAEVGLAGVDADEVGVLGAVQAVAVGAGGEVVGIAGVQADFDTVAAALRADGAGQLAEGGFYTGCVLGQGIKGVMLSVLRAGWCQEILQKTKLGHILLAMCVLLAYNIPRKCISFGYAL